MDKKLRILVVEDDQHNIEAAREMLAEHDLMIVSDYEQARKAIENTGNPMEIARELKKQGLPSTEKEFEEEYGYTPWGGKTKAGRDWANALFAIQKSLEGIPFDIVLTDVMIPLGKTDMLYEEVLEKTDVNKPEPFGTYVALLSIQRGIRSVRILTSGNHHRDPFVYAMDGLYGISGNGFNLVMSSKYETTVIRNREEIVVKNWAKLLAKLLEENSQ